MDSWFDEEARGTQGIIEEFGEPFRFFPYVVPQVNFPSAPDTSRRSYAFNAVFERDAKRLQLGLEETGVSTRQLCLTALACEVPGIRQHDRVQHCITGELFEVTDVKPDGLSGIEICLVQMGRQS